MNEAKLNELKSELEQNFTCSDKMNKLLQNLEELQENCDQKDAENKTLAEDVAHLHQASQRAQEEFQLLVEGKENEISSLKSELNCLQSEMKASTQSDLELSELQEKCDKLKAKLNQSHELVTKIKDNEKKTVDDLNAKLAELQEKVQSDQHIITSDAEKIRDFGKQVARMKLENEALTQQLSSENEKFNAQREQMEEKCNKS
uniref:Uncharacterized protein n=1 Tax=Ciona savignyi TaxID=51511 RepID=H2ZIV2_CIOSA